MPKWYKYLIVVAIAIFAICIAYDAVVVDRTPVTIGTQEIWEGGRVEKREPIPSIAKVGLFACSLIWFALGGVILLGEIHLFGIKEFWKDVKDLILVMVFLLGAIGFLLVGLEVIKIPI